MTPAARCLLPGDFPGYVRGNFNAPVLQQSLNAFPLVFPAFIVAFLKPLLSAFLYVILALR